VEEKEEKVIATARQVFLRYGYKRVTMADLAEAARISRPALYLVFPSKEEVFVAVMTRLFAETLNEIRQGMRRFSTAAEKLTFAFDVWCVRPFELIQVSPDAKDLFESSCQFATNVTAEAAAGFEGILAEVLEPLVQMQAGVNLSSVQIAHILASAAPGFKESSANAAQLRQLIAGLVAIVLASLQANKPGL
jgi:AcrR family transcriptional regulator